MISIVCIGVSGSGKTTIGQLIAQKLNLEYYDGDDFHPKENKIKMSRGIPLQDEDRSEWLKRIRSLIEDKKSLVVSCSCLKQKYREFLKGNIKDIINCEKQDVEQVTKVYFFYLKGSFQTIFKRLSERKNHYMKETMLKSQFETLEEPNNEKNVFKINTEENLEKIVQNILEMIKNFEE